MSRRHRRQSGQAVVLVAGAMTAILVMLALALMGGAVYWDRRHLQEIADSAALAGTIQAGGACTLAQAQAVADRSRDVLAAQLGPAVTSATSGGCAAGGYVFTYGFSNGTTVAVNWPYLGTRNDRVGALVRHSVGLELSAFVGNSAAIAAGAVAEASNVKSPSNYAVYAYTNITCGGASATTIVGSVYSGGTIDTNCGWYVKEEKVNGTTVDFGDILVYQSQPGWSRGGGQCTTPAGPVGNAICSDGYELTGNPNSTCAAAYPGGTEYLDPAQLVAAGGVVPNPSPCPGAHVPAPSWNLTPDPNTSPSGLKQNGAPCPVGTAAISDTTYPQVNISGAKGPVARASLAVPQPSKGGDGLWHFHPGCYAWIDIANVPGVTAVLDPGLYFFNGFFVATGKNADPAGIGAGGIALNAGNGRLLGEGVTLEFANPAGGASSFSGSEVIATGTGKTPSACGSGQTCSLGADPAAPVKGHSYFSAPCARTDPALDARCPTATMPAWCLQVGSSPGGAPVYDPSCYDVLVWAPPPPGPPAAIGGPLWFKGTGSYEWVYGVVQWPGDCGWTANGSSILIGALICNTIQIQGGSVATGPAVQYGRTGKNYITAEPSLIS